MDNLSITVPVFRQMRQWRAIPSRILRPVQRRGSAEGGQRPLRHPHETSGHAAVQANRQAEGLLSGVALWTFQRGM